MPVGRSPLHTCAECEQGDAAAAEKGQLIACARCPLAYHLRCMPQQVLDFQQRRLWLDKAGDLQLNSRSPLHSGFCCTLMQHICSSGHIA